MYYVNVQINTINQKECHVATKHFKKFLYRRLVSQSLVSTYRVYRMIRINIDVNSIQPNQMWCSATVPLNY